MKNIFSRNKKLTNRQIECLELLTNIYNSKNEPIHYTELAPLLKVSKWSTYDMLKTLERKRLVKPVYKELNECKPGKKGRRAVFFIPQEKSFIEEYLNQTKKDGSEKKRFPLNFNFKNLSKISPELYCISFLTAIGMTCLQNFQGIIPLLQNYITTFSSDPKSALLFIAYASVGAIIGNLKTPEAKKRVENNLNQYKSCIENMSEESLKKIFDTTVSLIENNK